jgi:hypothetical protein
MVDQNLCFTAPTPGNLRINGIPAGDNIITHSGGYLQVNAVIYHCPGVDGEVRLVVDVATNPQMAGSFRLMTPYYNVGKNGRDVFVAFNGAVNTQYWVVAREQQKSVPNLSGPSTMNFWTERYASAPINLSPPENATIVEGTPTLLTWTHQDPDGDPQGGLQVEIRTPATSTTPTGPSNFYTVGTSDQGFWLPQSELRSNTYREWRVRTWDTHTGVLGAWSDWQSFYVLGATLSPIPRFPIQDESVAVDASFSFIWQFRDPSGDQQSKADIRFRAVGGADWITLTGDPDPGLPGSAATWPIVASTIQPGYRYEWQVRTYDDSGLTTPSDWSESAYFWAINTPGWQVNDNPWPGPTEVQGQLGEGTYRVLAYDRGGQRIRGEIGPINLGRWTRLRDDISQATIVTSGFGEDCCALLSELRTWAHELVFFRNGERVWEGPITRIAYHREHVEIACHDPMVYVYRRILRQGYNDNYRVVGGVPGHDHTFTYPNPRPPGICVCGALEWGNRTVVDRSAIIIANALAPDDPNVLPWLTRFDFVDDAKEARSVPDWSKTAWEEVDSMAATGGLDYTTVGRRIVLFDTHRPIGRLPEMREKDFFEPPVLTEYGMSAANVFGVTNNSGIFGSFEYPIDQRYGLGPIEQLASEYGEADVAGAPEALTVTQAAQKKAVLDGQAERNISGRWPPPLVARVPDNSRVHPEANVGINQLVPGVHIPLRVETTCRSFAQMQKLDSVSVEFSDAGEQVKVVMSPAPGAGLDPDAGGGDAE